MQWSATDHKDFTTGFFLFRREHACKDIGLAVNTEKTKYMEVGRHRGMMPNEHIRI
jgi:hypothetical protein